MTHSQSCSSYVPHQSFCFLFFVVLPFFLRPSLPFRPVSHPPSCPTLIPSIPSCEAPRSQAHSFSAAQCSDLFVKETYFLSVWYIESSRFALIMCLPTFPGQTNKYENVFSCCLIYSFPCIKLGPSLCCSWRCLYLHSFLYFQTHIKTDISYWDTVSSFIILYYILQMWTDIFWINILCHRLLFRLFHEDDDAWSITLVYFVSNREK